jgi:hypothetical protein
MQKIITLVTILKDYWQILTLNHSSNLDTISKRISFCFVNSANLSSTTTTTTTPGAVVNQTQQTEDRIARLLQNDPNRINDPQWRQVATDIIRTENMDNALLVIHSNTGWSAVVQDSDLVQESVDGFGSRSIAFECNTFGIFSHVVQKSTDTGVLNVYVAQNGQIIKQANTGAAYGIVSIAGSCA